MRPDGSSWRPESIDDLGQRGGMKDRILGWDIGGANIKAACLRAGDAGPVVLQRPFPLWREPDRLPGVLGQVAADLGGADADMAVTMTAELADCFATKREGVAFLLDAFREAFPEVDPGVYGVDGRFHSVATARREPLRVAAANWVASATLVARVSSDAVFIDVGSTTTDIIPIVGGRVAARGRTDTGRLTTGELVYTGALRTPVAAIVRSVPLPDGDCRVAAEHFAVAADVYRWLGQIDASAYSCETPDGKGVGRAEASTRLARMVCSDRELLGDDQITVIARHVGRAQVGHITEGLRQVIGRLHAPASGMAVVGGVGAFLARDAAEGIGMAVRDLAGDLGPSATEAHPAVAVAHLFREQATIPR